MGSPHLVLLGDSSFDNAAYTGGEPDVVAHLRSVMPPGWRATLCAVDGATTAGLPAQVQRAPRDATHLIISIGGNDALQHVHLLSARVSSTVAALEAFARPRDAFAANYRSALGVAAALQKPIVVCTIYNGRLEPEVATAARMALSFFNDTIYSVANELSVPVIELRSVCDEASDYANPIEPSGTGGRKIARAIVRAIAAQG